MFRGALRFVFTFVFPMALLTTYPALALLGRLAPGTALVAFGGRAGVRGGGPLGVAPGPGALHLGQLIGAASGC